MQLIEPDEYKDFLAALHRQGFTAEDFDLQQLDTTDPKGDENFGLQGRVTLIRRSTQVAKEYALNDESHWLRHFESDLESGTFGRPGKTDTTKRE